MLDFATDFAEVISQVLSSSRLAGEAVVVNQNEHQSPSKLRSNHSKAVKASAKRIVRAVQDPLEEAINHQGELSRTDLRDDLGGLQAILEGALLARTQVTEVTDQALEKRKDPAHLNGLTNGVHHGIAPAGTEAEYSPLAALETPQKSKTHPRGSLRRRRTGTGSEDTPFVNGTTNGEMPDITTMANPLPAFKGIGGIPWYMEGFAPKGTTIHEDKDLTNGDGGSDTHGADVADTAEIDGEIEMNGINGNGPKASAATKKKAATKKRKRGWSVR